MLLVYLLPVEFRSIAWFFSLSYAGVVEFRKPFHQAARMLPNIC